MLDPFLLSGRVRFLDEVALQRRVLQAVKHQRIGGQAVAPARPVSW